MVRVNSVEFAEKWGRRLKGAVPDIRRGVERVTESPMEKAADAQEKMIARLTDAVNSGKWARGLRKVSLAEWKKALLEKGLPRIAAGVDGAASKMEDFGRELLAYQDGLQGELDGMPDVTIEDSINRASFWIRKMHDFERG